MPVLARCSKSGVEMREFIATTKEMENRDELSQQISTSQLWLRGKVTVIQSIGACAHSSNVVVENEGEDLGTVEEEIVAGVSSLHLVVAVGDLSNEAATDSGNQLRDKGAGAGGEGVEELLDIAVAVDGSEVLHVVALDAHDVSPDGGVVGSLNERGKVVSGVDGLIKGDVAGALFGGAELKTLGEAAGAIPKINVTISIFLILSEEGSLNGAEVVLLADGLLVGHGEGEAVVDLLNNSAVVGGIGEGDADGSDENESFVHLLILFINSN